jgi:ribosomal protein S27E
VNSTFRSPPSSEDPLAPSPRAGQNEFIEINIAIGAPTATDEMLVCIDRAEGSAMLDVECPQCANKMQAPDDFAGKRAKCVKCGHAFAVSLPVPDYVPVFREVAPLGTALGGLALVIGLVGICLALKMDPTVEASHLENGYRQTERIYNQGRMHDREIALVASATAALAGILVVGFSSLSLHITRAFLSSVSSR